MLQILHCSLTFLSVCVWLGMAINIGHLLCPIILTRCCRSAYDHRKIMSYMSENSRMIPYMGTIFCSNPVAEIKIVLWASDSAAALSLLERYISVARYPVVDHRIDPCLCIDDEVLKTWLEQQPDLSSEL